MKKVSTSIGSAPPDAIKSENATAPMPIPVMENKPAPGQTGPRGLAPRTTYSRVNAGSPATPDAGASSQKSLAPRGNEFLPPKLAEVQMSASMMPRPTLQDLIKTAMAGTISKVDITTEAYRQTANQSEGHQKQASAAPQSSSSVPTEYAEKLAGALDFLANHFEQEKKADGVSPGEGPGALTVTQTSSTGNGALEAGQSGQATSGNIIPKDPPTETSGVAKDPSNAMATNADMMHPEQPTEPIPNEKGKIGPTEGDKTITASVTKNATALFNANLARLMKLGEEKCPKCDKPMNECSCDKEKSSSKKLASSIRKAASSLVKKAEDAINPAQISAGSSDPPAASAAESAVPAQPSDVSGQASMVGSNQSAINYTKREAKADPKKDLGAVLTEPALSSAHDSVLQQVFDHTEEAGAKISSAKSPLAGDLNKIAAARALLTKLAQEVEPAKKKEKNSSLTPTPQGHSGFDAANMSNSMR